MKTTSELAAEFLEAANTRSTEAADELCTPNIALSVGGVVQSDPPNTLARFLDIFASDASVRFALNSIAGSAEFAAITWSAFARTAAGETTRTEGVLMLRRQDGLISALDILVGAPLSSPGTLTNNSHGLRFLGRHVLVTGAGQGIGAATATQFLNEGAHVLGVDLNETNLKKLEKAATRAPGTFTGVAQDITDISKHDGLIDAATRGTGVLDVLVNDAAVFMLGGVNATDEQWSRTMDVNLVSPAKLTARASSALARSGSAAVVNVASISAHVAGANRWTYNAAKGAIVALTKCEALDLAPQAIRVNSVSPGYTWTDVLSRSAGGDREKWDPIYGSFSMMNRCAEPAEIATTIAFLASDDASYVTGSDLLVDGGLVGMSPDGHYPFEFSS